MRKLQAKLRQRSVAFLASLACGNVWAVDCTGTVQTLSLQLDTQGIVTLSLSGGPTYTYLCAVDNTFNGVSPTVCRTMYATLMTAKTTGEAVLIRFHDYSSCTAVPAWAAAGQLSWTMLLL
jgi:hypothetical protein